MLVHDRHRVKLAAHLQRKKKKERQRELLGVSNVLAVADATSTTIDAWSGRVGCLAKCDHFTFIGSLTLSRRQRAEKSAHASQLSAERRAEGVRAPEWTIQHK